MDLGATKLIPNDILLVTFEHPGDVKAVVRLLYKNTANPFRLLIYDNGKNEEILSFLYGLAAEKGNVIIVEGSENKFCCHASNQLFSLVESPFAFYLCSYEAFVLEHGWDQRCIEAMERNPKAGLGGHLSWSKYYITGQDYVSHDFFDGFRNPGHASKHLERKFFHVQGGFFIIRTAMLQEIGGFNEAFAHNHMDVEFSYYVESMGWELLTLDNVLSIHRTTRPFLDEYDLGEYSVVHPLSVESAKQYLSKEMYEELAPCFSDNHS